MNEATYFFKEMYHFIYFTLLEVSTSKHLVSWKSGYVLLWICIYSTCTLHYIIFSEDGIMLTYSSWLVCGSGCSGDCGKSDAEQEWH